MYVEKAYMLTYAMTVSLFVFVFIFYLAVGAMLYCFSQLVGLVSDVEKVDVRWKRVCLRFIIVVTFPISLTLLTGYVLLKELFK